MRNRDIVTMEHPELIPDWLGNMQDTSRRLKDDKQRASIHDNTVKAEMYKSPLDSGEVCCFTCGAPLSLFGTWGWRGHMFCSKECSDELKWP